MKLYIFVELDYTTTSLSEAEYVKKRENVEYKIAELNDNPFEVHDYIINKYKKLV